MALGSIGMHTTIWLDGDRDEPITSGHPDGYLAFAPDGTLLAEPVAGGRGRRKRGRDIAALERMVADGSISALRRFAREGSPLRLEEEELPFLAFCLTRPDRRRRGLAGGLIGTAARALSAEGHRELHLVVTETNPARALYERLGFRELPDPKR